MIPPLKSVPNIITVARLIAVPGVIWLVLADRMTAAFWLFAAAGISDAIDGYLAKRLDARSVLGSYLDPLADKLLLVAIYALLGLAGHVPVWLVVLVVARDALLLGGSVLLVTGNRRQAMEPLMISKINTTLQIVLATLVLARLAFGFPDIGIGHDIMVYAIAVTTVVSGAAYLRRMVTTGGGSGREGR